MNKVGPWKIRSGASLCERWTWRILLTWLAVLLLALWYFRGSAREIRGQRVGTVRRGAAIKFATLSPDARFACVVDEKLASQVWQLDRAISVAELPGLPRDGDTAWAPAQPWLATEMLNGIGIYNFSGQRVQVLWQITRSSSLSTAWSPDGQRLAVASTTWIRILEAATGRIAYEWPAG